MATTTTSIRAINISSRQDSFSIHGFLGFLLWTLIFLSTSSIATASSSSHYESMQVLTSQGTSRQLQHAHKASQQGRWILAFALNTTTASGSISCTPRAPTTTILVLSRGPTPVLHRMTPSSSTSSSSNIHHDHHHPPPIVAMACTGLAGDAQWLIRQVQSRLMELWETYDHFITSLPVLAHGIAHWCNVYRTRGLVGRPTPSLWVSQSSSASTSSNEWTRPLGVQVLLVSTAAATAANNPEHENDNGDDPLYLLSMPPTGRIQRGKRPGGESSMSTTTTTTTTRILEYLCVGGPEVQRAEWDKKCQALFTVNELATKATAASTDTPSSDETLVDTIIQALGLHQQQQPTVNNGPNNNPLWIETLHPTTGLIQRKYEYTTFLPPPQPSRRRIF